MNNAIKRYQGKDSDEYRRYADEFSETASKQKQWLSLWYQSLPIVNLTDVHQVLEFGGGRDTTRALSRHMGIEHTSVDVSDSFFPDVYSTIIDYPYADKQYDLVCSFQCLEHNPFSDLDVLIPHMLQFSRRYFYISVPYRGFYFSMSWHLKLPKITWSNTVAFVPNWLLNRRIDEAAIRLRAKNNPEKYHDFHWWEVGMRGLSRKQFIKKIENYGLVTKRVFHNPLKPHHLFCLFEKK